MMTNQIKLADMSNRFNPAFTHAYMSNENTLSIVRSHKVRKEEKRRLAILLPKDIYDFIHGCYEEEDGGMEEIYSMEDDPDAVRIPVATRYGYIETEQAVTKFAQENGYELVILQ